MAFLFLATVLLVVCSINAVEFYRDVDGNCDDLVKARTPVEGQQVAPGDWYIPYGTLDGKCAGAYALIRDNVNMGWGDIRVIEQGKVNYTFFPIDVKFTPETAINEVTTTPGGALALVVSQNEDKYCFWAQCMKVGGKSKMGILFGIREPMTNDEVKKAFDDGLIALDKVGLKPKTFENAVENCPRYHTIKL